MKCLRISFSSFFFAIFLILVSLVQALFVFILVILAIILFLAFLVIVLCPSSCSLLVWSLSWFLFNLSLLPLSLICWSSSTPYPRTTGGKDVVVGDMNKNVNEVDKYIYGQHPSIFQ